jgi:hypothetical protein
VRATTGFVLLSAIRAIPVLGSHLSAANLSMTSRVRFIGRTELASASTLARLGSATGHDGSAPNLLYFSDTLATKYQGVWSSALVLIGSFASSERESVPSASAITSISWLWEGNNMVDIPQEYRRSATGPAGGMIAPPTGAERSPMPARGRPRRGAVAAERSREAERTQTDTPREQVDGLQEQIVQLRAEAETAERAAISR